MKLMGWKSLWKIVNKMHFMFHRGNIELVCFCTHVYKDWNKKAMTQSCQMNSQKLCLLLFHRLESQGWHEVFNYSLFTTICIFSGDIYSYFTSERWWWAPIKAMNITVLCTEVKLWVSWCHPVFSLSSRSEHALCNRKLHELLKLAQ